MMVLPATCSPAAWAWETMDWMPLSTVVASMPLAMSLVPS